jgi:hypothetical protein
MMLFLFREKCKILKKHGAFDFLTVKLILLTVVDIRNHHSRVTAEPEFRVIKQGHRAGSQSKELQNRVTELSHCKVTGHGQIVEPH